ncbi:MAG: 2-hydroxyglutaryl-CoA dehydratase [bacterium]|nr:2-hydroxyglutaryl-CoA dehydratase [bacterium]
MAFAAGVDIGSTQTKAVVLDEHERIAGRALIDTGANVVTAAEKAFELAMADAEATDQDIECVIGTGYGRYQINFGHDQVTEISCHARGATHMFPETRTVLDMGGQDTKAISVAPAGDILDFCMNDKCAAGTGRFLGAASTALEIPLDDLGPTALAAQKSVRISTTCTVFAESEILSWLGRGQKIEDILLGVHESIASRSLGLLRRVGIEQELTFSGGVAKNVGMVKTLERKLGFPINVSSESHFLGALGAGLFGLDRIRAGQRPALLRSNRLRQEVS